MDALPQCRGRGGVIREGKSGIGAALPAHMRNPYHKSKTGRLEVRPALLVAAVH
jgi:hypothetical protein